MTSFFVLLHALYLLRVQGQFVQCPQSQCNNRGNCTVTYDDEFSCWCENGWAGKTCLIPVPAACDDDPAFTSATNVKCEDWSYRNCPLAVLLGNETEESLPTLLSSCRKSCTVPSCGEPYPNVFTDSSKRITWRKNAEVEFSAHGTAVVKTSKDPERQNVYDARFAYFAHAISPPVDKVEFRIGGTNQHSALALSTTNTVSVTAKPKDDEHAPITSDAYGDYIIELPIAERSGSWLLRVKHGKDPVDTFAQGHGVHAALERFSDGSVALFLNGAHVLTFGEKTDLSRPLYAIVQPLTFHSAVTGIQLYGRKSGNGVQAMTLRPPLNKDCEGKFTGCNEQCDNVFYVSSAASGTGAACVHEHKFTKKCKPGIDACPRVPCPDGDEKCHGHGKCEVDHRYIEKFVCTCKDGWLGSQCDVPLSTTCFNDDTFFTRSGESCDDFEYANCDSATAYRNFTAAEENVLFEKCPKVCMVPPCLWTPTFRRHQKPESEVPSVEWTLSEANSLNIVHRGMTILRTEKSGVYASFDEKVVLHYAMTKLPVTRVSARIGGRGNTKAAIALSKEQTLKTGAQSMVGDFVVGIDTLEDTDIVQAYLQIRHGSRTVWKSEIPEGVEAELRYNVSSSKIDVLLNGKRIYIFDETVPADTKFYAIAQPLERYSIVSSISVQALSQIGKVDCVGSFGKCTVINKKCHKEFQVTTAAWGGGKQCEYDHKELVPCPKECSLKTKQSHGLRLNDFLSIGAGVVLAIVIIAYITCCCRRYKKLKADDIDDSDDGSDEGTECEDRNDEVRDLGMNPLTGVPWTEEEKRGTLPQQTANAPVDEKLARRGDDKTPAWGTPQSNVSSSIVATTEKDILAAPDPNISPRAFLNKKDADCGTTSKARVRGTPAGGLFVLPKTKPVDGSSPESLSKHESVRGEGTSTVAEDESPRRQRSGLQGQDSGMRGNKSPKVEGVSLQRGDSSVKGGFKRKGKGKGEEKPVGGFMKGSKDGNVDGAQGGNGGKDEGDNKGKNGEE